MFDQIEALLPEEDETKTGAFPLVNFDKIVVLCELVYEVSLAYFHEWNDVFKANSIRDCTLLDACFKSGKMQVQNYDKYDVLNLFHVNLVRALIQGNPKTVIEQLVSIRIKHNLNLVDEDWELD